MTQVVRELGLKDVTDVVDVVSDAFAPYPVMQFVLDGGRADYAERLKRFCHFIVMSRIHRHEFIFGAGQNGGLEAVALVSIPSRTLKSASLDELRTRLWSNLGADAQARYEEYNAAVAPFMPTEYHYHLNVLAVRHAAQGRGHARTLLEYVHAFARHDPVSSGVSLTTEKEINVALYDHFGYRQVGRADVAPGLTAWGFFRPNSAAQDVR